MLQHTMGSTGAGRPPASHDALASLREEAVGRRYCAWRGASDRRYVASIFAADPAAPDGGLPAFDGCILMAVACRGEGRRVLSIAAVERARDMIAPAVRAEASEVDEWHVHLLAETAQGRRAAVADLVRRHLPASR